jgi:hypothetical protein
MTNGCEQNHEYSEQLEREYSCRAGRQWAALARGSYAKVEFLARRPRAGAVQCAVWFEPS